MTPKCARSNVNGNVANGNVAANGSIVVATSNGNGAVSSANGNVVLNSGGWFGDPESDIPVALLPKHVQGLHAAGDMAFHKDFEAVHAEVAAKSSNDAAYPDILNGRGGKAIKSSLLSKASFA